MKNSIAQLVTLPVSDTEDLHDMIPELTPLLKKDIEKAQIPIHVLNAIASVCGNRLDYKYALYHISAEKEHRYLFLSKFDKSSNKVIFLEYDRFGSEIVHGSLYDPIEKSWGSVSLSEAFVRQEICSMLLLIKSVEGEPLQYLDLVKQFREQYEQKFWYFAVDEDFTCPILDTFQEIYKSLKESLGKKPIYDLIVEDTVLKTSELNKVFDGQKEFGYLSDGLVVGASVTLTDSLISYPANELRELIREDLRTGKADHSNQQTMDFRITNGRSFSAEEKSRLLTIPDWYVPSPEILDMARMVSGSAAFDRPFRNILLRGPAGSGKTEGAKALASMLGLPYGVVTGHSDMELFDLTATLVPNTDSEIQSSEELYEYILHTLKDTGLELPSFFDIAAFPVETFKALTGKEDPGVGSDECFAVLVSRLMSACKQMPECFTGSSPKFKVVYSDLTLGFLNGWLIELQEMNCILKPGVLVGLNNILENGVLHLSTGEVIRRHPDSVVVFTQNPGYNGTVEGNQSVYSRLDLKCELNQPTQEEMVKRIMNHVPKLSAGQCTGLVKIAEQINETCQLELSGGNIGTREIIAWAKATVLLNGNMRAAADYTLLPSVGEDPDDVAAVRSCLDQII